MVMMANSRFSITTKRSRLTASAAVMVVNEQARQVKKARKPGHHEYNVQAFEPEIISCHRDIMPKPVKPVTYAIDVRGELHFSLAGPPRNITSLR